MKTWARTHTLELIVGAWFVLAVTTSLLAGQLDYATLYVAAYITLIGLRRIERRQAAYDDYLRKITMDTVRRQADEDKKGRAA